MSAFRLFQSNPTSLSDRDVEMAIERELLGHNEAWSSTHTTSHSPVPHQEGIEMVPMEGQLPTHTPTIPQQNVEPGIMAIIEKQQITIDACMAQVSNQATFMKK